VEAASYTYETISDRTGDSISAPRNTARDAYSAPRFWSPSAHWESLKSRGQLIKSCHGKFS